MASARSFNPLGGALGAVDAAPLLTEQDRAAGRRSVEYMRRGLRGAARFLRRASGGRRRAVLRQPSFLVREAAAEQLEERQSDWAYSRPVVLLDILWNLAFVAVAAGVLVISREENPAVPLRLWVVGYGFQCVLHLVCVCAEYRRLLVEVGWASAVEGSSESDSSGDVEAGSSSEVLRTLHGQDEWGASVAKHLESANTMFSFIWWVIGCYWISAGGQALTHDAPQLYWLCILFLAFDVFFVVFCVALAFVISIAVCCCFPCIIALLYAVAEQEGASEEDIRQLPEYKFRKTGDSESFGEMSRPSSGIMTECGSDPPNEHVLSPEDAECCICLSVYDDAVQLRELPCSHHFHTACIDKWLLINAICPLCKFNILKSGRCGNEEI